MSRSLSLSLALALALSAGIASAADQKLIGIGDSITAGSSWPSGCGICPVVFDCTGTCDATSGKRDKCGYVRRLDSWLGAGYYVRNEGVGAQNTSEALSQFDSEMNQNCGTPGDCIGVILMHGTNDMASSVSPESARDNLAAMIAKARSRNIDTLLMTVVRKVYDKDNSKWADYRGLVLALAGSEDLLSVDSHTPLCDSFSCFNNNYWVDRVESQCTAPGEGDSNLGHLDPDGYGILTDLIKDVFPGSTPPAPSPTSPIGGTGGDTPDFVWPEIGSARWYELEVDGSTTWWEEAEHCPGSTCTVNPGISLSEGVHSWRVRGRNLRGVGSWSADTNFEILSAPGGVTPIGPTGELFESAPTYHWLPVAGAAEYDLEVRDAADNLDAEATGLLASTVCGVGLCSYVEGTVLTGDDDYTLKLRARNAAGDGPLSSPGLDFSILDCADASAKALEELLPPPVDAVELVEHCGALTAAALAGYTVEAGGALTVHTRGGIAIHDGFTVAGSLTVKNP